MSKFYKSLVELAWIQDHRQEVEDLYESCKPAPGVRVIPPKPTQEQKAQADAGELVECEEDEVPFVLNPVTKKWAKKESPVGRVICHHHAEPEEAE